MEFSTIYELLVMAEKKYGDNIFSSDDEKNVPYKKFFNDVMSLRNYLQEKGFVKKHIAITGPNSYEWLVCFFAIIFSGTAVPIDKEVSWEDIEKICAKAECDTIINVGYFNEIPENQSLTILDAGDLVGKSSDFEPLYTPSPEDYALFISTSGTMGNSRICALTHKNICADVDGIKDRLDCSGRTVAILPFHHCYTVSAVILTGIFYGTNLKICADIKKLKKYILEIRPTYLFLVPAILEGFCDEADRAARKYEKEGMSPEDAAKKSMDDLKNFIGHECGYIGCGGAAISPAIQERFEAIGIPVIIGYGMTECSPVATVNSVKCHKIGSGGQAIKGVTLKIIDPNENGEGEIAIGGTPVMSAYYNDPESTAEAFDDGYILTGDIGKIDEDGFVFVTGRKKNVIILSNGKNVMPEELENYINALPSVIESLVYDAGSVLGAGVYTENPEQCRKEIEELNKTLPTYKQLAKLTFIDHPLERNSMKKIIRKQVIE